jgi:hypothetical protein
VTEKSVGEEVSGDEARFICRGKGDEDNQGKGGYGIRQGMYTI